MRASEGRTAGAMWGGEHLSNRGQLEQGPLPGVGHLKMAPRVNAQTPQGRKGDEK